MCIQLYVVDFETCILLVFQGQPGLEGPTGPAGYAGCNGTKVSISLMFFFTTPSLFFLCGGRGVIKNFFALSVLHSM